MKIFDEIAQNYNRLGGRKRIFDYESVAISLYGCLESFVVGAMEEYLRELTVIHQKFSALPELIKDNHLIFCIKLASRLIQSPELIDLKISKVVEGAHEAAALRPFL